MYNILKELCDIVDVKYEEINSETKIYWYKNVLVLNEYRKVLTYTRENVLVSTENNRLNIEGENLKINKLSKEELIVSGKIGKVYFEK